MSRQPGAASLDGRRRARRAIRGWIGLILVVALVVGLAFGVVQVLAQETADDSPPPELSHPSSELLVGWDFAPTDLPDLVENSPAIVLAEVTAVREGDDLVFDPPPDGGDGLRVPTQRIDLHLLEAIDGETPADFTLFKIGGPGDQPEGSPRFDVGERDLLFVRPRLNPDGTAPAADGTWVAVAPDGRLEQLPSGELDPVAPDTISSELAGDTVPEAAQEIDTAQSAAADGSDGTG